MRKRLRSILFALLTPVALYWVTLLVNGWITDWQPEEKSRILATDFAGAEEYMIADSVLSFVTWNIGFGGLGAESDFFTTTRESGTPATAWCVRRGIWWTKTCRVLSKHSP
ncbi:MAG: hypothetical protein IPM98_14930 [Lewinellaceae bacterium]|nr:hypothetical protein [Lewinellaceae bacterium]